MRIHLKLLAATAAIVLTAAAAVNVATAAVPATTAATSKSADYLFVQTSKAMTYDAKSATLTLNGVSPVTLFFTDRPERRAGTMTTAEFIPFWADGADSFKKDPPNADLSIIEKGTLQQSVVELTNPVLKGDTLTYTVKVIKGPVPAKGANASVFIDIIGMPLSPVSVAGVARRTTRRAVMFR